MREYYSSNVYVIRTSLPPSEAILLVPGHVICPVDECVSPSILGMAIRFFSGIVSRVRTKGTLLLAGKSSSVYSAPRIETVRVEMPKTLKQSSTESSLPMEMRRELRYRLDIPAMFSWRNTEPRILHAEGITRDISVLGAFIVSPTCPPVDTQVEVEVILPPFAGMKSVVRIKGEARVIRVEHPSIDGGENGFAVVREASNQWILALDRGELDGKLPEQFRMTKKSVIQ